MAGRSGRGSQKGEVILQTSLPSHPVIRYAALQDFASFEKEELAIRNMFLFPPYTHIIKLICFSEDEEKTKKTLDMWTQAVHALLPSNYACHPPTEAGHAKVKDVYRFQALIRGPSVRLITKALETVERSQEFPSSVRRLVDVDPLSTFF